MTFDSNIVNIQLMSQARYWLQFQIKVSEKNLTNISDTAHCFKFLLPVTETDPI